MLRRSAVGSSMVEGSRQRRSEHLLDDQVRI
jgi:hypothetical protein